jgi:8-oxo-dGTP pyrophosphatase MutT (NUDIX family)
MMNESILKEKYTHLDINKGPGNDAFREGFPIRERSNVALIIKHPTDNLYLISQWKKVQWNGFLTGGIEEGESPLETAHKELQEESGFTHIAHSVASSFSSHGLFYHVIKKENRLAHYQLVFVQLASLEKKEVPPEELDICDFVWVEESQVENSLTRPDMKFLWSYYQENKNSFSK